MESNNTVEVTEPRRGQAAAAADRGARRPRRRRRRSRQLRHPRGDARGDRSRRLGGPRPSRRRTYDSSLAPRRFATACASCSTIGLACRSNRRSSCRLSPFFRPSTDPRIWPSTRTTPGRASAGNIRFRRALSGTSESRSGWATHGIVAAEQSHPLGLGRLSQSTSVLLEDQCLRALRASPRRLSSAIALEQALGVCRRRPRPARKLRVGRRAEAAQEAPGASSERAFRSSIGEGLTRASSPRARHHRHAERAERLPDAVLDVMALAGLAPGQQLLRQSLA